MKRIIVIGCPGAGKSHFSRVLCKKTGIPLYHLDMMYWNADKTTVEKPVFLKRLSDVLRKEEWITDGNYSSSMEMRFAACDSVFFLDYPLEVCLAGIRHRRGKPRDDMPWIETEEDAEFLEFVKNFGKEQRPEILALLEKYRDRSIAVFRTREEADAYLEGLPATAEDKT